MEMVMYATIFAILMIFILIDKMGKKKIGNIGENVISDILRSLPDEFTVVNNVRYRKCQIDHLVICHSKKLIFVIETKMWSGIISGDKDDKMWKVCKNGQVEYYKNPILQNKYHCKIVRQKYKGYSVRSIVVFVKCKSIPQYRGVIRDDQLIDYIMKVYNKVYNRGIIDR